jgi:hypothetical protein
MSMGMSRFPDPYQTRDDLSHATVFLIALLLLVVVGSVLYFGNAWLFAPVGASTLVSGSVSTAVGAIHPSTPAPVPSFTAPTEVPPLAGIVIVPTPGPATATAIAKASVTPAPATPAASPSPGAAKPAPPAATPTPQPSPTLNAHIGNTGGDGVFLRHTPNLNDKWIALADNTRVTLTGAQADGDGQHWFQARDPRGDVGWIPAQYLLS